MLLAVAVFRCAHLWTAPNIYIWDIDEVEFVVDSCFNCNNGRKVCSNFSLSICFCFFFISWLLLVVVVLIFESDGNLPTFHLSCGATHTNTYEQKPFVFFFRLFLYFGAAIACIAFCGWQTDHQGDEFLARFKCYCMRLRVAIVHKRWCVLQSLHCY